MQIVLYLTDDCALCECALTLLTQIPVLSGSTLVTRDIAYDDELLAKYGEKIPVLSIAEHELNWPFTRDEVVSLMRIGVLHSGS